MSIWTRLFGSDDPPPVDYYDWCFSRSPSLNPRDPMTALNFLEAHHGVVCNWSVPMEVIFRHLLTRSGA